MNLMMKRTFCTIAVLALICASLHADVPQSQTARVVASADAFIATLDQKQHDNLLFKYDDEAQRARWSNLPTTMVKRAGLKLGDLSEPQRTAAMGLVSSLLSKRGFEKVQQIMEGDQLLTKNDNRSMFGKDLYYISILGTPSEKDPWMVQFGGHHLGLNITIVGEKGTLAPSHTGSQPALYQFDGKTVRPLGQESDKALALLNALDDSEKKKAILNYRVADLVLGPGKDGKTIQPEGLKGSEMNDKQREMLLDLVSEWVNIASDDFAKPRMSEIKADINETWFAWSGPTTAEPGKNVTGYFRVQGPKLVIEYAPQKLGGDLSMHLHTIYRDPTNDYGRAASKK